jgi:hypothetical protein
MKIIITLLLSLLVSIAYAQTDQFKPLLDTAKAEFKKEFDDQNYARAVDCLERAVRIKPDHAEARYWLGYAYSRLNSKDAKQMTKMDLGLTLKASEQFEAVNKLSPKYTGELLLLDPYSKIGAEWGSMAMNYWYYGQEDSARWAFNEGRKRGGFGDFILAFNRKVLNACSQNTILTSLGDNSSFSLWYLQIVEHLRKDITIVDMSLLNTTWYPKYLSDKKMISFGLPDKVLDTLEYCAWKETPVTIGKFSWTIKPSYGRGYLLRADRIFLSLLKKNNFQREVAFTIGFSEEWRLSLKASDLEQHVFIDKLIPGSKGIKNFPEYKTELTEALQLAKVINKNNTGYLKIMDMLRFNTFETVDQLLQNDEKEKSREIIKLVDTWGNEKDFPYENEGGKQFLDYIRTKL